MSFRGRIDRQISALGGHFRLDTGARSKREHAHRVRLFDTLLERYGALDTIRALQNGTLSWADVLQADREGRLGLMAAELQLRRPLWEAVASVFPTEGSPTVQRYRRSMDRLRLFGLLAPSAKVVDLALVDWKLLAHRWGASGTDWNHLRRAVSRLITLLSHADHSLWVGMRASIPIQPEHVRMPTQTQADVLRVLRACDEDAAALLRTFLLTGLRGLSELFKRKAVRFEAPAVQVSLSKTRWGKREILVDPRGWETVKHGLRAASIGYWSFIYRLDVACNLAQVRALTPHALRHLAGQTLDRAGIPYGVQQSFLGHRPASETHKYTAAPFTAEHAAKLYDAYGPVFPPTSGVVSIRRKA